MINKIRFYLLLIFIFSFISPISAMDIHKDFIAKIPEEISSNLIGLRVNKDLAYVMASDGNYVTINLTNGNTNSFKIETNSILDFDVVVGKIIYLDENGMLCGHVFPKWPKGPYNNSCKIEACDQGAIISGGNRVYFLAKNAKSYFEIPDLSFAFPINNGFIWALTVNKEKHWEANLYDCYGNLMGNVYKFSEYFEPSNLEIGPNGIEGELLVSAIEGKNRTLSLIANNGRMFWKINGPNKVCKRDVAFDSMDDLIVLEKNDDNEVIISRWKFKTPEG